MQLICHHDPTDPNHLICETKLPWKHRVVEIGIGALAVMAVIGGIVFLVKSPLVDKGRLEFEMVIGEGKEGKEGLEGTEGKLDESQQYSGQSELILEAEAVYYSKEGEQMGRGPWPPQAEQETKLMVFLKLGGLASPIAIGEARPLDIVFTGKLGPGVQWTGFAPQRAGLAYDPQVRKIFWRSSSNNLMAAFEVAVQPSRAQLAEPRLLIMEGLTLKNRQGDQVLFPNLTLDLRQ